METGHCYSCKRKFTNDPATVTTFLVDLATGYPPGFSPLGTVRPAASEAVNRSVDLPVCPDCVERARGHQS